MRKQKLILFDFDGVVVDSLDVYEGTTVKCLAEIGQPIVKNRNDYLDLYDDNFYKSLVEKGVDLDAFMEASVDILAEVNYDDMRLFDELVPVLARLHTDNILVVISSSDSRDIDLIMKRYRISGYFEGILGSDVNLNKIKKILHAMDKFGIARENTYYVGDTIGDIKEAKAAGIKTIAVGWGWHSREKLAAVSPDYLIDYPEELLEIC